LEFDEARFVVEELHLGRAAGLEEVDDPLGGGRELGEAGESGGLGIAVEESGEGSQRDGGGEEGAARERPAGLEAYATIVW
jgi:hypothetical protein